MIYTILKFLILVLPLLIAVAYFTLVERTFGLLQPLADGLKLFVKETILPSNADIK
ncbi:hypothetical protein PC129_g22567 [Phytophthora cactorum]|uniref:Uncharacterized protein n=1 Tax=Phytophthora cactorum TaxID=29920 RepID=A0A8T1H2N4_9STRA|nr:hypothetical protein PC129_g22567 [Phytophthora cactorum]